MSEQTQAARICHAQLYKNYRFLMEQESAHASRRAGASVTVQLFMLATYALIHDGTGAIPERFKLIGASIPWMGGLVMLYFSIHVWDSFKTYQILSDKANQALDAWRAEGITQSDEEQIPDEPHTVKPFARSIGMFCGPWASVINLVLWLALWAVRFRA